MSDEAFRKFVAEVRGACDRFLLATEARAQIAELKKPPPRAAQKPAVKGNPRCRCGHGFTVHETPRDDAAGTPKNICRGCEAEGSKIGCPEFVKKGTLPVNGGYGAAAHTSSFNGEFSPVEAAILAALAVNHGGKTAEEISILTVYTQSGTFNMALANLRDLGLVQGSPIIMLTAEGRKAAIDSGADYSGAALRRAWIAKLKTEPTRRMLSRLADHGPMSTSQLAEKCGYTESGTFNSMLAKLRRMGLVEEGQPIRLCKELS